MNLFQKKGWIIFLGLWMGCQSEPLPQVETVFIKGRFSSAPIYQVKVPLDWAITYPKSSQDLKDTTLPLLTLQIDGQITITFHNFPSQRIEERILPEAQVARWKKQIQIKQSDLSSYSIEGFGGFRLEASGIRDGKEEAVIAYAMQLTPQLYKLIDSIDKRSDWTVKAIGKPSAILTYRQKIDEFVESLEWVDPVRLPT